MEELGEKKSDVFKDKPFIGLRWILVFIIFGTNFVIFFVRNSISVTVVAMINSTTSDDDELKDETDACPAAFNANSSSKSENDGEFNWTPAQQGIVLGAYYWGFVLSRLFLSRMGEVIGQRETVSIGLTGAGILALLSPLSASLSPYALATNRFFTGVFYGPNPGTTMSLIAVWAPRSELASMNTTGFSGATIGIMLGIFIAGWLSENFSWRLVFYIGGVLNLLIPPVWMIFVRNSPFEHPLISNYERNLLIDNINIKKKKYVPWLKIFTSPYVLICVYALFARIWLDIVLNTDGPSFLRYKIGLDLDTASYVTSVNNLCGFFTLLIFGKLSDFIMNRKYLSKIYTRKLFHAIATVGTSVLLLGVIIAGCNATAVVVLWLLIGGIASASAVSFSLSVIDVAPNYTATVNGLMGLGTFAGAVAPSVTSALLKLDNGWNKSFYLGIGLNLLSCFFYVLFMTAEPQSWNFEDKLEESKKEKDACDTRL